MTSGKLARSEDFKHLLWRRYPEPAAWDGCRPEILATDGREVRRLSSQHRHIAFQCFIEPNLAQAVATRVESSVSEGVALMGYSMFKDSEVVAILHTADGLEPGWVAFPYRSSTSSTVPTLPIRVANLPRLRLVGGATVEWVNGHHQMSAAIEQRGESFSATENAFDIIKHVRGWEVWGRVNDDGRPKNVRIVSKAHEPEFRHIGNTRREGTFFLDDAIWKQFSADPTFTIWFVIQFDRSLFCLPDEWLQFWFQVELTSPT